MRKGQKEKKEAVWQKIFTVSLPKGCYAVIWGKVRFTCARGGGKGKEKGVKVRRILRVERGNRRILRVGAVIAE